MITNKKLLKNSMMTFLSVSLFSLSSSANSLTPCQLAHPMSCHDCIDRVEATCSGQKLNGAIDGKIEAAKVEVKIFDSKNGSEKVLVVEKSGAKISELNNEMGLKKVLTHAGLTLTGTQKAEISSVWVPVTTAFYKSTKGTAIAGKLKSSPQRQIASEKLTQQWGGVQRAMDARKNIPENKKENQ
jgi:hypothetical protein